MARSILRRAFTGAAFSLLVAAPVLAGTGGTAGAVVAVPSWHPAVAPLPSGAATTNQSAPLTSVACGGGVCVAGGNYTDTGGSAQSVLLVRSGGKWTATEAVLPAGGSDPSVSAVACGSGECVAVGSYGTTNAGTLPLVAVESAGSWTFPAIADEPTGFGGLTAAACSNTLGCVAFGRGYAVDEISGTWTATTLPLPTGFHHIPSTAAPPVILAASCAAKCVAVGNSNLGGDPGNYGQGAVLVQGSGTTWTDRAVPLPSNAVGYNDAQRASLNGLACKGGSCVAVGSYETSSYPLVNQGLLDTRSGGRWSVAEAPLPSGSTAGFLSAVSCLSVTSCIAVGGTTDASSVGQNLVLTGAAGQTWSASSPASPSGASSSNGLTAVSCGSPTMCAATGSYYNGSAAEAELLAGSPSAWTAVAAPLPGRTVSANVVVVQCLASSCVAAGSAALPNFRGTKPLFENYRA